VKYPRIYTLSEYAVTVEFGDTIDPGINRMVISLHDQLAREPFSGFRESVPAYASLTVYFDPLEILQTWPDVTAALAVGRILEARFSSALPEQSTEQAIVEVPVCYDPSLAADLTWVAEYARLSVEDVARLHTARTYRVYMIGFVPGFPYMGITDPAIEVPRKQQPALSVPAGSVALAGRQTGIYPAPIPGGWQVIGRTPIRLFNPDQEPYTTFRAGMTVRFTPIPLKTYQEMAAYADSRS
jgi:inhibitor of KinA